METFLTILLEQSLVAKQLFNILKTKIQENPNQRVFVVELKTIKDKEKLQLIMETLEKRNYLTHKIAFNLLIINTTEKCVLRISKYDNW